MTDAELVDIVDAHDNVIGALPRTQLASARANHRVVHVLLVDARGRLLLQRPAPALGKSFELGSSVAGHVRSGESYAAAAARELSEELGVPASSLEPVGTTWIDEGPRRKFIGVFTGTASAVIEPDPGEVAGIEFLHPFEIRRCLRDDPRRFSATFAKVFRYVEHVRGFA